MIIKRFSAIGPLNTNMSGIGFTRGRKYDMDLGRLGKMSTSQRELSKLGDLRSESRKLGKELNKGRLGKWEDID